MDLDNLPVTKNGIPWTGLYKFDQPVKALYIEALKTIWNTVDWGDAYENYRRPSHQKAIYPNTRFISTGPFNVNSQNKKFHNIATIVANDLLQLFPQPMCFLYAEMTLLTPNGGVPWHHDRMSLHSLTSRVLIPFTYHGDDIKYQFCSWNKDTPLNEVRFEAGKYLSNDITEYTLDFGYYHVFNNRVPHTTLNSSSKPRGILMVDVIPTDVFHTCKLDGKSLTERPFSEWSNIFGTISEFERQRLGPSNV